jgi:hypothetical protein
LLKNGVVAVFGNVNANEVKQLFEQALGKMKPGALALTDLKPPAPIRKRKWSRAKKEKAQGVIMVGYRGVDMFNKDRHALELIDEASSDLGSRFFIRIPRANGSGVLRRRESDAGIGARFVRILSRDRSAKDRTGEKRRCSMKSTSSPPKD